MGTPHPPDPTWRSDASPAERALWQWAVQQLDDEVLVLPGVRLTALDKGQDDVEVDLVLIDPGGGVLAVEVKGGEVSYDVDHGIWWRQNAGRRKEIRDPVEQAQRARSLIRRVLAENGIQTETLTIGWAVATPDCRIDAPGGGYLPASQLWDSLASDQLARRYAAARPSPGPGHTPPGSALAYRIAQTLRGRPAEGRATVAASIALNERRVVAHTESHRDALHAFAHHDRVLVTGAAGTGKTALALHAATMRAAFGGRTLVVCWNAVLGSSLRRGMRDRLAAIGSPLAEAVTDELTGNVVAGHAAGLVTRASGVSLEGIDPAAFFKDELPWRLDAELCGGRFDTIVIDEAQDFGEPWLLALDQLLTPNGCWFAFAHADQDLFHTGAVLDQFFVHRHQLRESFRKTKQIAAAATMFTEVLAGSPADVEIVAGDGPDVRWIPAPAEHVIARARETQRKLQRAERLQHHDMALLYLFNNPHKGNSEAVVNAEDHGELVVTNAATYKGMERPVVVLGLDLNPEKAARRETVARVAYVGATRARSLLVIVGNPEAAAAYGFTKVAVALDAALHGTAPAAGSLQSE